MKRHIFWSLVIIAIFIGTYYLSLPQSEQPKEHIIKSQKVADTDKFYTIRKDEYIYKGGAHGSTTTKWKTITKENRKEINDKILNQNIDAQFKQLIKQGLIAYFTSYLPQYGGREFAAQKLADEILIEADVNNLPLPKSLPFLAENGVGFMYGQYEISSYANGQPAFVIPYQMIMPYLNNETKELIKGLNKQEKIEAILP